MGDVMRIIDCLKIVSGGSGLVVLCIGSGWVRGGVKKGEVLKGEGVKMEKIMVDRSWKDGGRGELGLYYLWDEVRGWELLNYGMGGLDWGEINEVVEKKD